MTEWLPIHFSLSCIGEGNGNPLQCSCLENPRDGGAWWAAVYGVALSRTRLKWLSSSSSSYTKDVWYPKHMIRCSTSLKSESEVTPSCPTLCDHVDCSLLGSSVHGILQARILEWTAISFSRGSSQPRDQTWVSHIAGRPSTLWSHQGSPVMTKISRFDKVTHWQKCGAMTTFIHS